MFEPASPWVSRFASLIPRPGPILDVACGEGRHLRYFLSRGYAVTGLDKRIAGLADILGEPALTLIQADLEVEGALEADPPLVPSGRYAGVVVTNYLFRPLFPALAAALTPGGVLVYETFMTGHERFGRPENPAYHLQSGELLGFQDFGLEVIAFEQGEIGAPRAAVIQRLCAIRPDPDPDPGRRRVNPLPV